MIRAPEKKASTLPAPSAPLGSFTSIFAQLQQRQKEQDREKRDAATKAADVSRAIEEDKKKKKKSVKWKTGDDLVKVQIIEWQEPEGDYYGGGSGMAEYGDTHGEGAALKNRNFIEEEEDLMEWTQPKPVDFESLYRRRDEARNHPEKRAGTVPVESEEAKIQKQRELVTLAAFYNSQSDIPYSPKEPEETAENTKPAEQPTDIPLPDDIKTRLGIPIAQPPLMTVNQPLMPQTNDLSSLLSFRLRFSRVGVLCHHLVIISALFAYLLLDDNLVLLAVRGSHNSVAWYRGLSGEDIEHQRNALEAEHIISGQCQGGLQRRILRARTCWRGSQS